MPDAAQQGVILFDGDCAFCSASVRFIIRRDHAARFRFASLQSPIAADLLARANAPSPLPDSLILLDALGLHTRSAAALRIARRLRFPWPLLFILTIVPLPWRNAAYDAFAKRRRRILARHPRCDLMTPDVKRRILDRAPVTGAPPFE